MERTIVLASHGKLAEGLLDTAKMIIGEIAYEVVTYVLQPGRLAEDFSRELSQEIIAHPQREFVILTNLYGASVFSAMYPLSALKNVWLFTGMNINMLLSLCLEYPNALDERAVMQIQSDAQQGIKSVGITKLEEEDF